MPLPEPKLCKHVTTCKLVSFSVCGTRIGSLLPHLSMELHAKPSAWARGYKRTSHDVLSDVLYKWRHPYSSVRKVVGNSEIESIYCK